MGTMLLLQPFICSRHEIGTNDASCLEFLSQTAAIRLLSSIEPHLAFKYLCFNFCTVLEAQENDKPKPGNSDNLSTSDTRSVFHQIHKVLSRSVMTHTHTHLLRTDVQPIPTD